MKTVTLSKSYVSGSTAFDALAFREPELSDYRAVGRLMERQGASIVTFEDRIWVYADRLLQDLNPGVLAKIDLTDAIAVEEAMLGFFTEARRQWIERLSLSSASDGGQVTSTN